MVTIAYAVESCNAHPTQNAVMELGRDGNVKIPVCEEHVSDVCFGLEPTE